MPGKRNRKDSEKSTGNASLPSSSSSSKDHKENATSSNGAANFSSSSSSSENVSLKSCCYPPGCLFGPESSVQESLMVKLICNYDSCTASQFMHSDCFKNWEEGILNYLRSHGRARSWSDKQRRQNLWTKKGYDLAYRACLCQCKHGHLRKDLDWPTLHEDSTCAVNEQEVGKKKNRRKHKDLPSLGNFNALQNRTKSKPIPNKDSRMRHNSTSSVVSVDQGYISASPGTSELGPYMFSPPHHHTRFSFGSNQRNAFANGLHAPSTSPLPEVPDDGSLSTPPLTPSPTSTDTSPVDVFSPPMSPEGNVKPVRYQGYGNAHAQQREQCTNDDIQAMTALIDNLWNQRRNSVGQQPDPCRAMLGPAPNDESHYGNGHVFGNDALYRESQMYVPQFQQMLNYNEQQYQGFNPQMTSPFGDVIGDGKQGYSTNAQLLVALRQKEEEEKRNLDNYVTKMMSLEENSQVIPNELNDQQANGHPEIRMVPMRQTKFAKRYDFSLFEEVLPHQNINPYHVKMEGEGYGSDDLRNFILSSLSMARCSQMNCVMCGVDMPVYDHFPLVDGTMYLSPEKNERNTKNCFKIKIEGKHEYVHAACTRCIEGVHNIICRLCNSRWEGSCNQLGTLYMYDIFAAKPCCQQRLSCKNCGGAVVDVRTGLDFFSEYSARKTCPHCHSTDHHFVRPATTYKLMGLVFS